LPGQLARLLVGTLAIARTSGIEPGLAKAVVQIGPCSGTLVAADGVLTSAHCLNGPIEHVVVDGKLVRVATCEQHGSYRPGLPAHDLGYCRLSEAVPGALSIDDGPAPGIGAPVSLAGFGLSSAMSREKPSLRAIASSVVRAQEGWLEVGSATATACRGDSGGPMLVERDGRFRVAGVIHGARGAICASPTEVVPVSAHRGWLLQRMGAQSSGSSEGPWHGVRILMGALLVSAVVVASIWRRRARRPHGR
jgi:secreted trypsin-like serine protease